MLCYCVSPVTAPFSFAIYVIYTENNACLKIQDSQNVIILLKTASEFY